jgi:hypothetical protein
MSAQLQQLGLDHLPRNERLTLAREIINTLSGNPPVDPETVARCEALLEQVDLLEGKFDPPSK